MKKLLYDKKNLARLARYIVTGVLTTVVNFGVFLALDQGLHWDVNLANSISVLSAVIFAFITNKRFVFRSRTRSLSALFFEVVSFFSARALTMFLEVGGVFVTSTLLNWNATVSKIGLNILVLILNYILSKCCVFRSCGGEINEKQ